MRGVGSALGWKWPDNTVRIGVFYMRHAIATAPTDGSAIILEDDASGTYEVAHWSAEAREWVSEKDEPSKITPSHWYPMPGDKTLQQDRDQSSTRSEAGPSVARARRYAAWSTTTTLVAAALAGIYFRAEFGAYVTRYAGLQDIFTGNMIGEWLVARETRIPSQDSYNAETDQASVQEAAQEAPAPEPRKSVEEEPRAEVLSTELAEARRTIDGANLQQRAEVANSAQLLGQEGKRTAAAMQEATTARQEAAASAGQRRNALEEEPASGAAVARELAMARREIETNVALLNKARDDGAQFKQTAEMTTAKLQTERERAEASSRELAVARREIETYAAALNKARDDAVQFRKTAETTTAELQQERDRAEASSRELAIARGQVETNVALNKARDYASQFTQTAERTTAELQQERARAEASSRELDIARREIETNVALLNKARDDAAQFKQTAERMTAELQQERARAEASSRALSTAREPAQRAIDAGPTLQRIANSQISQATHAVEAFASKPPVAHVSKGDAEVAKLMARARALLGQGNIAAARIVLESAAETGSAQASFTLAETYDPIILAAWGTHGTRGDATKARELYTQAHAGGIQEAKTRVDALDQ
jgi:hypothetical protein